MKRGPKLPIELMPKAPNDYSMSGYFSILEAQGIYTVTSLVKAVGYYVDGEYVVIRTGKINLRIKLTDAAIIGRELAAISEEVNALRLIDKALPNSKAQRKMKGGLNDG